MQADTTPLKDVYAAALHQLEAGAPGDAVSDLHRRLLFATADEAGDAVAWMLGMALPPTSEGPDRRAFRMRHFEALSALFATATQALYTHWGDRRIGVAESTGVPDRSAEARFLALDLDDDDVLVEIRSALTDLSATPVSSEMAERVTTLAQHPDGWLADQVRGGIATWTGPRSADVQVALEQAFALLMLRIRWEHMLSWLGGEIVEEA